MTINIAQIPEGSVAPLYFARERFVVLFSVKTGIVYIDNKSYLFDRLHKTCIEYDITDFPDEVPPFIPFLTEDKYHLLFTQ